jgi:hypothetical protein
MPTLGYGKGSGRVQELRLAELWAWKRYLKAQEN